MKLSLSDKFAPVLLSGLFGFSALAQELPTKYAETITPQDLKKHLTIIASDSLEGRDTGSPGQKKAAEYVTKYYKQYGFTPIATDKNGQKTFLQHYNLYRSSWDKVELNVKGKVYKFNEDFYVNGLLNVPATKVDLVFAGYGIESDKYNDYANLDVTGKGVVILDGEPTDASGNSLVSGGSTKSKWGNVQGWRAKVEAATKKGAKFVFVVSSKSDEDFAKDIKQRALMLLRMGSSMTLKPMAESLTNNAAIFIPEKLATSLLGTKASDLAKIKQDIASSGKPVKSKLKGQATLTATRKSHVVETENVAAFMEGSDLKDEVLVISAHLDHIGISADGQINNGADDDGSGTVSLLELAEAFSKAKAEGKGPRRSILFLNVTGEEKGLLGSEYYSEHPLLPLKSTIANLNIDMVGRVDADHKDNHNYVYLIGSDKLSSQLHAISETANSKTVKYYLDYTFNDANDPNRFYYRSDHYNFAKHGVPVIFYFTGVHEDYHRPGDDVEKILFDKQSGIVKLIFYTAWELVNRTDRIKVDSNKP